MAHSLHVHHLPLPQQVATADRDGRLLHQSDGWMRFTGLDAEQWRRHGWTCVAHPDDAESMLRVWRNGIAAVHHFSVDFRCRRVDGRYRACTLAATPLFSAPGSVAQWLLVLMAHEAADGTDDDTAVGERRQQVLSTLAHGLRDPLQAMRQASFVLQLAGVSEGARAQMLEVIERQIARLARISTSVLDLTSLCLDAVRLRRRSAPLDVLTSLAVAEGQEALTERGHRLEVTVREPDCEVTADPERVVRAIGELLDNASRYSEPGARVTLEAYCTEDDVIFTVTDEGIGIAAESLPRIFDPMRRDAGVHGRLHGRIGIGLAFARHVARLHGGALVAESDGPGHGSRFHLRIPRREPND